MYERPMSVDFHIYSKKPQSRCDRIYDGSRVAFFFLDFVVVATLPPSLGRHTLPLLSVTCTPCSISFSAHLQASLFAISRLADDSQSFIPHSTGRMHALSRRPLVARQLELLQRRQLTRVVQLEELLPRRSCTGTSTELISDAHIIQSDTDPSYPLSTPSIWTFSSEL